MSSQASSHDEERFARYRGYNPEFYKRAIANNKERARKEAARQAEERTRLYELEREQAALRAALESSEKELENQAKLHAVIVSQLEHKIKGMSEAEVIRVPFRHTVRKIEERACKVFKVRPSELRSERRPDDIVFARQFVYYWAARLTQQSYPQIGRMMGGKDHTSVIHGKRVYPKKRALQGRFLREAR